jgi:probable O-glycosylation ligase (exosortase A-associated)
MVMPQKYMDRISTIGTASEDSSFQGRLDAWEVAWHTALDRPMGAGFEGPQQPANWDLYLPGVHRRASHSIYFMVLGEHGFIGLTIYLAMIFAAWRNLVKTLKLTRDRPELLWAKDLAQALQVSVIGFLVGGAALPMAYYTGCLGRAER